ncbi:DUF3558 domain-containing protein [Salinifilum ghardaiensis]
MPRARTRTSRRFTGGALAACTAVLSGCALSSPDERSAHTAPPPPPPPPTSSSAPPPERPADVPLNGVDPCALLTDDQREQLGFDRAPVANVDAGFSDAPACSHRNTTARVGARIALVATEDMSLWTDDTAQVEATRTTVQDFPALVIKTPGLNLSCNVAVSTAQGQHIDVLYRDDGGHPPPPLEQLCSGAHHVAEEAVATLTSGEPGAERGGSVEPSQ